LEERKIYRKLSLFGFLRKNMNIYHESSWIPQIGMEFGSCRYILEVLWSSNVF
jgi:hypothetical protein